MAILSLVIIAICVAINDSMKATREEQKAEQRQLEQNANFIKSLYRFPAGLNAESVTVLGVDSRTLPENLRKIFVNELTGKLKSEQSSRRVITDTLLPDFYSQGYFDRAFSGNVAFLDETQFFQNAGALLLIKPAIQFTDSSVASMKSCTLTLTLRKYKSDHTPADFTVLSTTGVGFSEKSSMKKALEALDTEHAQKITTILK